MIAGLDLLSRRGANAHQWSCELAAVEISSCHLLALCVSVSTTVSN